MVLVAKWMCGTTSQNSTYWNRTFTVPGFSPRYPAAHCTNDGSICELVTGEAEVNAAATISALVYSSIFDLKETYFLIAGISGINPKHGTIGSVTFARFAIQVALQHEIDAREMPADWAAGYFPLGASSPTQYPVNIYGTEVFEVNDNLRQLAFSLAQKATLNDSAAAQAYRANYNMFGIAAEAPTFALCDTATSDNYWHGAILAEAFENTTTLFTNSTGVYCSTQQEDNATLEVLLRGTLAGLVDFSRIIIMRTASNFDRPHPGQTPIGSLLADSGGFSIGTANIYHAGVKVVQGIIEEWESRYKAGVKPDNYIGDILGSLGGTPGFGRPSL
ncbi:hypothetical protein VNI00_010953 [Paramarasmius palmivorus]|uniref:Purine nucleoside permease n=1 Tax=Paramarasmius palmivorus TaxID=297713 RepID=A0AAW0CGS1_9AGAR